MTSFMYVPLGGYCMSLMKLKMSYFEKQHFFSMNCNIWTYDGKGRQVAWPAAPAQPPSLSFTSDVAVHCVLLFQHSVLITD